MGSRRNRKRQIRRDRRKAKASGWKRAPKGKQVGHGTNLGDTLGPMPAAKVTKRNKKKDRRVVYVAGPRVESPLARLRDREESGQGDRGST